MVRSVALTGSGQTREPAPRIHMDVCHLDGVTGQPGRLITCRSGAVYSR